MTMTLAQRSYGDVRVLALSGRLDHGNSDTFQADLTPHVDACAHAGQAIVLDLSRLDYISSAGLRCFMLAAKQAKALRGRLMVAAMQPLVAEIFHISRFNRVFETFASVREALASVSPPAADAFDRSS